VIQADRIRTFVRDNCIERARRRGDRFITIRCGDVHKAMKLKNKMPAVCAALRAHKFEEFAGVRLVKDEGPRQGSNLYLTFSILRQGEYVRQPPSASGLLTASMGTSAALKRRSRSRGRACTST